MNRQRRPTSGLRAAAIALVAIGALIIGASLIMRGPAQADEGDIPIRMPDPAPTLTIGPAQTAPALSAAPLYSNSFASEVTLNALQLVDFDLPAAASENKARWAVSEGNLLQRETVARRPATHPIAALAGDSSWADVQVSVSFYSTAGNSAGLIARRNGDTYYRYTIIADEQGGSPKQALVKVVDGVSTTLVEIVAPGYTNNTWHTLSMTLRGGAISVTLDGKIVVEDLDPEPLPGGQAGIATRAMGSIRFDNLIISPAP
jgi:hypothetical protein